MKSGGDTIEVYLLKSGIMEIMYNGKTTTQTIKNKNIALHEYGLHE